MEKKKEGRETGLYQLKPLQELPLFLPPLSLILFLRLLLSLSFSSTVSAAVFSAVKRVDLTSFNQKLQGIPKAQPTV